jgi:L-asparaginase
MRNTLKLSSNYPHLVESGAFKKVARAIFSSKRRHKLQVHKVLDSNVVIIKMFPESAKWL